jgi:para-aminobenzoate synthetase component 1
MDTLLTEFGYQEPEVSFARFAGEPFALFFDSALKHPQHGRYSFIAADPFRTLTAKDGEIAFDGKSFAGDPFAVLAGELARHRQPSLQGAPPFQGGAAGYFAYDLCHHLERLPPPPPEDEAQAFPDMAIGFYDVVVAFDLWERRAWILSTGHPESDPGKRRDRARGRSRDAAARLEGPAPPPPAAGIGPGMSWESTFTAESYQAGVAKVIDYIWAGDIFQANLSQCFRAALPADFDPFGLYLRLRRVNPAPFAGFMNFGDGVIASSSPERFLKVRGDHVETRPIKGTRRRGRTAAEDAELAQALRDSAKDRCENVMIVDLLRNDLSRVCRDHSVHVPELCVLESYATVHHLVSTVTGRLRQGQGPVDLLRAAFPGGSVTGAPKVRAMEIIAELEPTRRGPYCGAMGYIGFDGAMDTNIAIRTLAFKNGSAVFQAGGGIVADSDPALEYAETLDKAKALFACFENS